MRGGHPPAGWGAGPGSPLVGSGRLCSCVVLALRLRACWLPALPGGLPWGRWPPRAPPVPRLTAERRPFGEPFSVGAWWTGWGAGL
eukprot:15462773-Alexandrium_andersonii.AAC.1